MGGGEKRNEFLQLKVRGEKNVCMYVCTSI
jgi:hypothetical protein